MYDAFSQSYDFFVDWSSRLNYELPFLELSLHRLAAPESRPARVLDAACGTGWHAITLAQRGWQVTGTDYSSGMVEHARRNALQAKASVKFFQAGFGELASKLETTSERHQENAFDAVLCLGNSLPHALDAPALQAALADFANCLAPGGLVFIQNRNFDLVMQQRQRWMEPQSQHSADDEHLFIRFYDFRPDGLIDFNILDLQRLGSSPWQQQIHTTRLKPLLQTELADGLVQAGFEQIEWYGDMQGNPFDPQRSGNLIAAAIKHR